MNKPTHKAHPAAELFPLMAKDELQTLAADIKKNGLLVPITLNKDGALLEGRNRLNACQIAGVEPRFDTYRGNDPVGFVMSANIHRRHLTTSQKRDLVAKLLKLEPGKSDRQVAATAKVSPTTVANERKKAEARGDVCKVDTRTDTKGRKQPAKKQPAGQQASKGVPLRPVGSAEVSIEQRKAENAALDAPKEDKALREFKFACDFWLPKMNSDQLKDAIAYCHSAHDRALVSTVVGDPANNLSKEKPPGLQPGRPTEGSSHD